MNTAEKNTKEIGIRKVLGASVGSIMFLLSQTFRKWVLAANVIAWPLTYVVISRYWLAHFPFRVSVSLLTFCGSGLIALGIALATVSFQPLKAALANPADSIRYE
jgi:putative ABC transport system permease protein